jgi:hypothetical protein
MKHHTSSRFRTLFTLASALAIWPAALTHAAETPEAKSTMHGKSMDGCAEIMEQKQQLLTEMTTHDDALVAQVAAMNRAPANQKPELMAAIVTTLVEQRAAHRVQNAAMEKKMMTHMMGHMAMSPDSMASCPMMKDMHDTDGKTAQTHAEH